MYHQPHQKRILKETAEILESPTSPSPRALRVHDEGGDGDEREREEVEVVVGGMRIADYKTSPRRFGTGQKSTSSRTGPGFPQRILLATTPEQLEKCDKGKDEATDEGDTHPDPLDFGFNTRPGANELFFEQQQHHHHQTPLSRFEDDGSRGRRGQGSSHDLMFLGGSEDDSATGGDTAWLSKNNFTLSPETTTDDSNYGDLDSYSHDLSSGPMDYGRLYTAMPVLEDGLSSGHVSDAESYHQHSQQQQQAEGVRSDENLNDPSVGDVVLAQEKESECSNVNEALREIQTAIQKVKLLAAATAEANEEKGRLSPPPRSPVWVPRLRASQESLNSKAEEVGGEGVGRDDELDTDLETDRLLGQQRLEDHFYQEDNNWVLRNKMNLRGVGNIVPSVSSAIRHDTGSTLLPGSPTESRAEGGGSENGNSPKEGKSPAGSLGKSPNKAKNKEGECFLLYYCYTCTSHFTVISILSCCLQWTVP